MVSASVDEPTISLEEYGSQAKTFFFIGNLSVKYSNIC